MFSELLPIAVGVIVSPVAIAAVIALLMTRGGSLTAVGFLVGWAAGVFAMVTLSAWLADVIGFDGTGARPVLALVEFAAAGLLVAVAAVQLFGGRGLASWSLSGLDGFRMPQAAALGFGGSVLGPKVILLTGIAGATIATTEGDPPAWPSALVFALIGSIGVALPVLVYLVARDRVGDALVRARSWITVHDRAASVVSLLIVAGVLVLDGVVNRRG